jgi:isoleucyl-tRNA synthetase
MHEILEVLVRLMAPILSFTAEEIWQYMNGSDRPASVHSELFIPVKDEFLDPQLSKRWETIVAVRRETARVLELARKEKKIGHSLDASVTLALPAPLFSELEPYKDQLRSIFIVSSVDLVKKNDLETGIESETIPGLKIRVSPSDALKCERCWVHDPSVGTDMQHPALCDRCRGALAEMEFIAH